MPMGGSSRERGAGGAAGGAAGGRLSGGALGGADGADGRGALVRVLGCVMADPFGWLRPAYHEFSDARPEAAESARRVRRPRSAWRHTGQLASGARSCGPVRPACVPACVSLAPLASLTRL